MFRRKPKSIGDILGQAMRQDGLETPLIQRRLIAGWDKVAGTVVAKYTTEKYIKNQTLFVKISNPAMRADLAMRRTQLASELNKLVGSYVISDIKIY